MMRNVISEITGHIRIEKCFGAESWDMSELSKYLERGKSEFRESREVADAQKVE